MQHQFLILNSGMILKDLKSKGLKSKSDLDELVLVSTGDGSISLKSTQFNELFHSSLGALKESKEKYIKTSELDRFNRGDTIYALDVCLGMGYNTACLLDKLKDKNIYINLWGLELDKRPLNIALNNNAYLNYWSNNILNALKLLVKESCFKKDYFNVEILWGDARRTIHQIPLEIKFDLIYLDAFSPKQCPQLWSEEFLTYLVRKLADNGRII